MKKRIFLFNSTFIIIIFFLLISPIQKINAVEIIAPPALVFDTEPELVVIPRTYVYYVSKDDNDLFFYQGLWWRPWHDIWYRSDIYSGPWVVVEAGIVPFAVINLPDGWRAFPPNIIRLRWVDVRWHWRSWYHDRYWEHYGWRGHYRDFDRRYRDRDGERGRDGWHR